MKKTNIKTFIIISLLVVLSLSSTYAFLTLNAQNDTTTGVGGCFEVEYTGGQNISSDSLVSTTDPTDDASTEISLYKNNNCEIYTEADIKIHTNPSPDTTAPIDDPQALKYKIVVQSGDGRIKNADGTTTTEKTGVITTTGTSEEGDTILAQVSLTETATTYKIYIWIDSNVSQGAYNGTTYSGYLYATSIQSSTITG